MDTQHFDQYPRPRSPFSPWLLAALAAVVLTAAMASTSFTAESRDFIARQAAVHGHQAL